MIFHCTTTLRDPPLEPLIQGFSPLRPRIPFLQHPSNDFKFHHPSKGSPLALSVQGQHSPMEHPHATPHPVAPLSPPLPGQHLLFPPLHAAHRAGEAVLSAPRPRTAPGLHAALPPRGSPDPHTDPTRPGALSGAAREKFKKCEGNCCVSRRKVSFCLIILRGIGESSVGFLFFPFFSLFPLLNADN